MKFIPRSFLFLPVIVCVIGAFGTSLAVGEEWRAINPGDLESMTPVVDKDADAEAIFWEAVTSIMSIKSLICLVGAPRFELGTPCPPDRCANRAALRSAKAG